MSFGTRIGMANAMKGRRASAPLPSRPLFSEVEGERHGKPSTTDRLPERSPAGAFRQAKWPIAGDQDHRFESRNLSPVRKEASLWFAAPVICVSLGLVSSQAWAVRQGPLGPTSTGSIGITVSVAAPARTSAPTDIPFGAPASVRSKIFQRLCLASNTAAHAFSVSATGGGEAGALVLSDGRRTVPYEVTFPSPEDTGQGDAGRIREGSRGGCKQGQRAIAFIVAIDPEHVEAIQAGTGFAGILTLIIAPG